MSKRLEVFSIIIMVAGAIHFRLIAAKANVSTNGNKTDNSKDEDRITVTFAWIEKPPYTMPPTNESFLLYPRGILRDSLLHIIPLCGRIKVTFFKANSEFEMIELLRQNKAHTAAPIFEPANHRRYSEFLFFNLHDYPGTVYITTGHEESIVIFQAVMKTWPLIAFTLILTAIAGVIIWVLVGLSFASKILNAFFSIISKYHILFNRNNYNPTALILLISEVQKGRQHEEKKVTIFVLHKTGLNRFGTVLLFLFAARKL